MKDLTCIRLSFFGICFLLFFVMILFISIYYGKEELHDEIHHNFTSAVENIKTSAIQIQMLNLLCNEKSVNVELAQEMKDKMATSYANLFAVEDQFGKLISPSTYCALNQFLTSSSQLLVTPSFFANFCSLVTPISQAQMVKLTQKLNKDESNINIFKEYFAKKRYQRYSPTICVTAKASA